MSRGHRNLCIKIICTHYTMNVPIRLLLSIIIRWPHSAIFRFCLSAKRYILCRDTWQVPTSPPGWASLRVWGCSLFWEVTLYGDLSDSLPVEYTACVISSVLHSSAHGSVMPDKRLKIPYFEGICSWPYIIGNYTRWGDTTSISTGEKKCQAGAFLLINKWPGRYDKEDYFY